MRRLVQSVKDGALALRESPRPILEPTRVLVEVRASLISSGTERSTRRLASGSLLAKARARPDLVRKVIDRARREGLGAAASAVRSRLGEEMELGYSAAGVVLEVGEAVAGIRPGQRVATAGEGHAEVQAVAANLAAVLPDGVEYEEGAFGAVASVALHGLRLAGVGPGDRVLVVGLGLIGQLAARLARAAGATVAGVDLDAWKVARAAATGVEAFGADEAGWEAVQAWSQGQGADAVLVTAATRSSEPMLRAAGAARDRGVIVLVGDVGLDLDRRPLYEKELTVRVARSYGPGRYDPAYEEWGVDYPIGYVRWTLGRNLEAVMGLIDSGRLEVADLITHRRPFDEAVEAYRLLADEQRCLGIVLDYPASRPGAVPVRAAKEVAPAGNLASSLIGAGRFAAGVLLPAAREAGFGPWMSVASGTGAGAERMGRQIGFRRVVGDPLEALADPAAPVVFVASRHDSHAAYVTAALEAGKHVFCEKPLALTGEELAGVVAAWEASPGVLMVGFNRRWSPAVTEIRRHMTPAGGPLQIIYRVYAGALPDDHWLKDRRMGGRLLGEACHFVDTATALVGADPLRVMAAGTGRAEVLLEEDFTITIAYRDGSQAVVVYSSAAPKGTRKESVEVIGRHRSSEIDDFGAVTLRDAHSVDSRTIRPADKGHSAELAAFRDLVEGRGDPGREARSAFQTTAVMLAAVESLMTGVAIDLPSV